MHVLWQAGEPLLPGEINDRLNAGYAYTSIATVLTRLQAKGLLERSPAGRAFAYRPVLDESALAVRRIAEVLDATSDRSRVLGQFIGGLSEGEATVIRSMLDDIARRGDAP